MRTMAKDEKFFKLRNVSWVFEFVSVGRMATGDCRHNIHLCIL